MKRVPSRHSVLLTIAAAVVLLIPESAATSTATPAEAVPVGVWPLRPAPEVVHYFDPPADPWGSGHRGADLAGSVGQAVHSALPGTVAFVGYVAGKPVITIEHGGTRTTYEPVVSTLSVGTAVDAGSRLGALDLAFSHCFPAACLHWGWLRGRVYLDPLDLVQDGRVRLLPLWRDDPVTEIPGPGESWWSPTPLPYAGWSPQVRRAGGPAGRPVGADPW